MTIGNYCKHAVITTSKNTSVFDAAKLMKQHNIGDIVVVDETNSGMPVGIFTDRDIAIKIVAEEVDPRDLTVGDAMSQNLLVLQEHQQIQETVDMMCAKGVRRAPIIDKNNKIIGIATLDDLFLLFADQLGSLAKLVRKQILK